MTRVELERQIVAQAIRLRVLRPAMLDRTLAVVRDPGLLALLAQVAEQDAGAGHLFSEERFFARRMELLGEVELRVGARHHG